MTPLDPLVQWQQQQQQQQPVPATVPTLIPDASPLDAKDAELARHRRVLETQRRVLRETVDAVNEGVRKLQNGHDAAVDRLGPVLRRFQRVMRHAPFRRRHEAMAASLHPLHALPGARIAVPVQTAVAPSSDNTVSDSDEDDPEDKPEDATIEQQQQQQQQQTVGMRDPDHPVFTHGDIHVAVPLPALSRTDVDRDIQQHHHQQQQQSAFDDPQAQAQTQAHAHFSLYRHAVMLSLDEIAIARDSHHEIREADYEAETDEQFMDDYYSMSDEEEEDEENCERRALQAQLETDLAIESEFLQLLRSVVVASVAYNMALVADLRARTPAQHVARRMQHARRAFHMYGSAIRHLPRASWISFGTATHIRIAAANNRTLLRIDQRLPLHSDSARTNQWASRSFHEISAMLRFRETHFRHEEHDSHTDGILVRSAQGAELYRHSCNSIPTVRLNILLWFSRAYLQWTRRQHAPAA